MAALRLALSGLNMAENTVVNKETGESTYDIAAKIDKVLKDYPEEKYRVIFTGLKEEL